MACAIVAASLFNSKRFLQLADERAFEFVIAVDAGFASLADAGVVPDLAIGDFDSLGFVPEGVDVESYSWHKDASDMELALDRACKLGYDEFYVFGALGKRLDHTIANIQLFAKFSESGIRVFVEDIENELVFLTGPASFCYDARDEGTVSVFSLTPQSTGVFERGLEWELADATLTNRSSLGLSNELKGEPIQIGVNSGTIVVFLPV